MNDRRVTETPLTLPSRFQNRDEAARLLADRLAAYRDQRPLVLAIPRGGVPMGRIVADALGADLDVVLVHKLGAPGNPEFAVGAVEESGQVLLGEAAARLPQEYIDEETRTQLETLKRRRLHYGHPRVDPAGRVVIVVDDGVATGTTLLAALDAVRRQHPARLIAAIGVAPHETAEHLRRRVDELICLLTPSVFFAVSQFFSQFPQVSDDEVVAALGTGGAPA